MTWLVRHLTKEKLSDWKAPVGYSILGLNPFYRSSDEISIVTIGEFSSCFRTKVQSKRNIWRCTTEMLHCNELLQKYWRHNEIADHAFGFQGHSRFFVGMIGKHDKLFIGINTGTNNFKHKFRKTPANITGVFLNLVSWKHQKYFRPP